MLTNLYIVAIGIGAFAGMILLSSFLFAVITKLAGCQQSILEIMRRL